MSAVCVPNDDTLTQAPVKDGGSWFRFEMVCDGGKTRAYADTADELLAVLLGPTYGAADEPGRLHARIDYATRLTARVQAVVYTSASTATISEADRAVLLQPRHQSVVVDEWSCEVPLVLVDVHYFPHTETPAPRSTIDDTINPVNLIWLRPADSLGFLVSLATAGVIDLAEQNDYTI